LTLGRNLRNFQKKLMFFKLQIYQHPLIGKFQNWMEMNVSYPTNKRFTLMDFSDNFQNIKKFVQVDYFEDILCLMFCHLFLQRPDVWKKKLSCRVPYTGGHSRGSPSVSCIEKSTTEWTTAMETQTKSKVSSVKIWPNLNPVYIFGL
jgi:hypothetical protein